LKRIWFCKDFYIADNDPDSFANMNYLITFCISHFTTRDNCPSNDEIRKVVFDLNANSAPGPDDFGVSSTMFIGISLVLMFVMMSNNTFYKPFFLMFYVGDAFVFCRANRSTTQVISQRIQ